MKRLLVLLAVLLPMAWFGAGCGGSLQPDANAKKGLPPPGYEGMEKRMMAEKQAMMKQAKAPPTPTKQSGAE